MVTIQFEYVEHSGKWWITRHEGGEKFYPNSFQLESVWSAHVKVWDDAEMKTLYDELLAKGYHSPDGYPTSDHKKMLIGE